jgi:hypothetical protein
MQNKSLGTEEECYFTSRFLWLQFLQDIPTKRLMISKAG